MTVGGLPLCSKAEFGIVWPNTGLDVVAPVSGWSVEVQFNCLERHEDFLPVHYWSASEGSAGWLRRAGEATGECDRGYSSTSVYYGILDNTQVDTPRPPRKAAADVVGHILTVYQMGYDFYLPESSANYLFGVNDPRAHTMTVGINWLLPEGAPLGNYQYGAIPWTAEAGAEWIHIDRTNDVANTCIAMQLSVAPNVQTNVPMPSRSGTVRVADQTVNVKQDGYTFALDKYRETSPAVASEGLVWLLNQSVIPQSFLMIPFPWYIPYAPWTASTDTPWIHLKSPTTGEDVELIEASGSQLILYRVDDNSTNQPSIRRQGTIKIADKTLLVTQRGGLEISDVRSQYCSDAKHCYFLSGVPLDVDFDVEVDWNGATPGLINTPTEKLYGPDHIFWLDAGGYAPGTKLTALTAVSEAGEVSPPHTVNCDFFTAPELISTYNIWRYRVTKDLPTYRADKISIKLPFNWNETEVPNAVPLVGGRRLSMPSTSLSADAEVRGNGTAKISGQVKSKVSILGASLDGSVRHGYDFKYLPDRGWLAGGYAGLGVSGKAPGLLGYLPFTPIYFRINIGGGYSGDIGFKPEGGWKGQASGTFSAWGDAGCGLATFLSLEGFFRGSLFLKNVWDPLKPPAGRVDEAGINLSLGYRVVTLVYEREYTSISTNLYWIRNGVAVPYAAEKSVLRAALHNSEYRLLDRGRMSTNHRVTLFPSTSGSTSGEACLAANTFPYGAPAVAYTPDTGENMLLWLRDDPARSAENRTELMWAKNGHTNAAAATALEEDGTADFSPAVCPLGSTGYVAAWENISGVMSNGAALQDMLSAADISVGVFDGTSNSWVTTNLTHNAYLDRSPCVAAWATNKALVAWVENEASDIQGGATAPNRVRFSEWHGSTWGAPGTITTNVGTILWQDLTCTATSAWYACAIDMDNDFMTPSNTEIFVSHYDGSQWAPLWRVTSNDVRDMKPTFVSTPNGVLDLAWVQGGSLVTADVTDLAVVTRTLDVGEASSAQDYAMLMGANGEKAVAWVDSRDGEGPNVYLSVYDPLTGSWGMPHAELHDQSLEYAVCGYIDTNHCLRLFYDKAEPFNADAPDPFVRATDFCTYSRVLGYDVQATVTNVMVSTNVDGVISVAIGTEIENKGDYALTNLTVAVYSGDPAFGGSICLETNIAPMLLIAGSRMPFLLSYMCSAMPDLTSLYVVADPYHAIPDTCRSNDSTRVAMPRPDLVATGISVTYASSTNVTVCVVVENRGNAGTDGPFSVRVESEGLAACEPMLQECAALPISAARTLCFEIASPAGLTFTSAVFYVSATVDCGSEIAESDEMNNSYATMVGSPIDTDGDGVRDYDELLAGTNPQVADTDGDGVNDLEEELMGTDPCQSDTDHDAMSDLEEIVAGTDFHDPQSRFQILGISNGVSSNVVIQWTSAQYRQYLLDVSSNLTEGFRTAASNIPATPPVTTLTNDAPVAGEQFYRVRVQ